MKKKQLFIPLVALVVGMAIVWWFVSPKTVAISVTDANKTPDIYIYIFKADTDELLLQGKTNSLGVFRDKIQIRSDEEVKIKCSKEEYVIKPGEFVSIPSGKPLSISVSITAEMTGKEIVFRVKNSVPNIWIDGVNEKGQTKFLGSTGPGGVLKAKIHKQDFQKISFSYKLSGAVVLSDHEQTYSYESVPKTINLKVIP
nr:hypothetical protein [Bacteroidota bacterium]